MAVALSTFYPSSESLWEFFVVITSPELAVTFLLFISYRGLRSRRPRHLIRNSHRRKGRCFSGGCGFRGHNFSCGWIGHHSLKDDLSIPIR